MATDSGFLVAIASVLKFLPLSSDSTMRSRMPEALVDSRTQAGQFGQPPESRDIDEQPNPAPRPKRDVANGKSAESGTRLDLGEAKNLAWNDQRQSPRIRCSGSVEFRTEGSEEHLWGTLTDISLHGCYVEMDSTFAVGTNVYLVMKSLGARIQTRGTVRTSSPSLGMGISFTGMEPGQLQHLQLLLEALSGSNTVPRMGLVRETISKNTMGTVDSIAFLDEITEFFRRKPLLSREEFHQIAERVRRP
jgi:PilZ domain